MRSGGSKVSFVVDCGRYSTKMARISSKSVVSLKEIPNDTSIISASVDDSAGRAAAAALEAATAPRDAGALPAQLSRALDGAVGEDESLTLLLLLDTLAPQTHRAALLQHAFEAAGAQRVYMGFSGAAALFAAAATSGVAVDIGYGAARLTPVVGGAPEVRQAVELPLLGAAQVDAAIVAEYPQLLSGLGLVKEASGVGDRDEVENKIKLTENEEEEGGSKESSGSILSLLHSFKTQFNGPASEDAGGSATFTLPDGNTFSIEPHSVREFHEHLHRVPRRRGEQALGPEAAHVRRTPPTTLANCLGQGIAEAFFTLMTQMAPEYPQLFAGGPAATASAPSTSEARGNWVLCGASAAAPGLRESLRLRLSSLGARSLLGCEACLLPLANPATAAVEGGIALSQLSTLKGMCATREDYEEQGPERCVHNKVVDSR